jgi:hypothetical protein
MRARTSQRRSLLVYLVLGFFTVLATSVGYRLSLYVPAAVQLEQRGDALSHSFYIYM